MMLVVMIGSNRTIVGLKDGWPATMLWLAISCSNRTIVGLKEQVNEHAIEVMQVQQSHHCGIESASLRRFMGLHLRAAIAPLWD